MTWGRHLGLGSTLLVSLSFTAVAGTLAAERAGLIELAQRPLTEEEKKKEQQQKKGPPPKAAPALPPKAAPPPPPKAVPPPPPKVIPPPAPRVAPPPPPLPPAAPPPPPKAMPQIEKRLPPPASGPPPKSSLEQPRFAPDLKKDPPRRLPAGTPPDDRALPKALPGQGVGIPPAGGQPPQVAPKNIAPKAPLALPEGPAGAPPAPKAPQALPQRPVGAPPAAMALPGPKRFDEVQKGRQQRVEDGGRRTVIQEPGNRVILKQDNRVIIRHDEAERFRRRPDARSERRPDGGSATFYVRPDGMRVVTEVDGNGRLVRRYRRSADGREYNIIDNRRFLRNLAIGVGVGAVAIALLNLPPPRVSIPREKYIVDYDAASDEDLEEALEAPPIERLERAYSLEEVRDNFELRQRMRHISLGNIAFEFGAWEVTPDQYPKLERLARVLLRILDRNSDEVVMIEGHTDAVGSDVDNLSLSDRRASSVANILTETFGVPAENLVTQGYGEQYLKVPTQGPEILNRRVDVRRITPLMAEQ